MKGKKRYETTEVFRRYEGKNVSNYSTFAEKITCARVNYKAGARKRIGLSIVAASQKIGISFVYLKQLEDGTRKKPDAIIVHNIERLYGFEPGVLAGLLSTENNIRKKSIS